MRQVDDAKAAVVEGWVGGAVAVARLRQVREIAGSEAEIARWIGGVAQGEAPVGLEREPLARWAFAEEPRRAASR